MKKPSPNILFIFIDDLRPDLGCYGNTIVKTPHIDKLASEATVFGRHYVVVPTCGASRYSLLTGKRPRNQEELSNNIFAIRTRLAKQAAPTTVPESFVENLKTNGYYTVGIGKISHSPDGRIYKYNAPVSTDMELPRSWHEMLLNAGKWGTGWNAFFAFADGTNRTGRQNQVLPYERAEVDDKGYPDGLTADLAVTKLEELAENEEPFFLGVGFFKPHLPFNAPAKYWDMYVEDSIPLTPSPDLPVNVHTASLHESGEFNNGYKGGEEKVSLSTPLSEAYSRRLKHGYFASISYIDEQVGKLLAALQKNGQDENTIVVLWGDHGWHLGDHRIWGKHTLSEWSLRSPLIIRSPGNSTGAMINKVVSSVDVYPTLMELAGLPAPAGLDGKSLVPLLRDQDSRWTNAAYSYFNKGITVRTERYRLTRYHRAEQPAVELYDYQSDPYEHYNISAANTRITRRLLKTLNKGETGLFKSENSSAAR